MAVVAVVIMHCHRIVGCMAVHTECGVCHMAKTRGTMITVIRCLISMAVKTVRRAGLGVSAADDRLDVAVGGSR